MNTKHGLSRRRFLIGGLAALGGAALSGLRRLIGQAAPTEPGDVVPRVYLPLIAHNYPPPESARVVHVHDPDATSWDFSTGWYGDYVSQSAVDRLMEEGLKSLTGTTSVQEAWQQLLPNYQSGQRIAIKVNFNNSGDCGVTGNKIDGLAEPVNALIATLKAFGVAESDIWIYDALRALPNRFVNRLRYTGVRLFDSRSKGCREDATFNSNDPNAEVDFQHPDLTNRRLTDVVVSADYLINMPIMKFHGIHPVTLGFKNHFGSLDNVIREGNDNLHWYIAPDDDRYSPAYSPMVDINANPHIADKTVLIVGEALFGAKSGTTQPPLPWDTFEGDAPNILFLSRDPVAVDCVMTDFVRIERNGNRMAGAYDYLFCAQEANLGTCEGTRDNPGGDPWQTPYGSGYSQIEYLRIDL